MGRSDDVPFVPYNSPAEVFASVSNRGHKRPPFFWTSLSTDDTSKFIFVSVDCPRKKNKEQTNDFTVDQHLEKHCTLIENNDAVFIHNLFPIF